jgi:hypothetical protein
MFSGAEPGLALAGAPEHTLSLASGGRDGSRLVAFPGDLLAVGKKVAVVGHAGGQLILRCLPAAAGRIATY